MRRLSLLAALLLGASCTDANLTPVLGEENPPLDDKLALHGRICTRTPADEQFPVKILFVIDTSYSSQVTDPGHQRVQAVTDVMDRYAGNPAVYFGVIAFDSVVSVLTDGFTQNPDVAAIAARLDDSDRLTDYQGALASAYGMLAQDMATTAPETRARTKYVIIFFSDGSPDPRCDASLGTNQPLQVCLYDRDEWPEVFDLPDATNPDTGQPWTWDDFQALYPEMEANRDYNTDEQLVRKVEDIIELQEVWNVNEIRFHTALLFDPDLDPAFIAAFNLNRDESVALMTKLKDAGNGTFTEFTSGGRIDFLNVNYTSVKQTYRMTNLIAFNRSTLPTATGPAPDSDGDGVPDTVEDELRLCASDREGVPCRRNDGSPRDPLDTDDDGYSDAFEHRLRSSGFDPALQTGLTQNCVETGDLDGDGLRDCEEAFLGSDPRLFDTDADRIPDGLEFRAGLDPLRREDALGDDDADGTRNLQELLQGWTPVAKEPVNAVPPRIAYEIVYEGETPDGRNCYEYDVSNITLVTTRAFDSRAYGENEIRLVFLEGAPDDPHDYGTARVACVKAKFVKPDLKLPASGLVELADEDFVDLDSADVPCVPAEGRADVAGGSGG